MTLADRSPAKRQGLAPVRAGPQGADAFLARIAAAESASATIRLRPRQKIAVPAGQDDLVYVVRSGVLISDLTSAEGPADHLGIIYPGDVVNTRALPSLGERVLIAVTPAEAVRMKAAAFARLISGDAELFLAYERRRSRQAARAALHAATLGSLEGLQRLASFLIDMALELGTFTGPAVALEMPLSRAEVARHLALNADTLSRLTSRLKADGLLMQTSRHRMILKDWRSLVAMSPIAEAILALDRDRVPLPAGS